MDELIAIVKKFEVLLTSIVTLIPLTFVFRRQLGELGELIDSFVNPAQYKWRVDFGKQVRGEQRKVAAIQRQIPVPSVPAPAPNAATPRGRDLVLEAWGAVKQTVYDGCVANGMVPAPRVGDALGQLRGARTLSADLIALVVFLDERGLQVASDRGRRPRDDDALAYRDVAHYAVARLWQSALVPLGPPKEAPPPSAPPRRATLVGGDVVQPSGGTPSAALVAVAGPMRGQQYRVDKSNYRLGRNANNDLCAAADDAVSGDHACLRYQNGGLFLYDQGSLNGTFLNEQRVTGAPVMVRFGDRIRVGESVFEVVGTSASPSLRAGAAKDDPPQGPSRSVVR